MTELQFLNVLSILRYADRRTMHAVFRKRICKVALNSIQRR